MGCPQKNEVSSGTCSALINERPLAEAIIKATQEGLEGKLPLSVKTRLGWNEIDMSWPEFLLKQNIYMLTIHGRTRKEMSKVPAHWDQIGKVRELRDKVAPDTLIVGNGDVLSHAAGIELAEKYKLDGIMIGRGIFHDPYVFADNSPWDTISKDDRINLYKKHVELFKSTWQDNDRPVYTLNKFCKIYINGFENAKEMREQLMSSKSVDELLVNINSLARVI
jgi:tRNA-dihydrouridine synthase